MTVVAADWSAVLDNVTGLMWEMKTDNGGLHDKDWNYSWYEPDYSQNNGVAGKENGGSCGGSISCDTYNYVNAVNAEKFCGFDDWRLPTKEELRSIYIYYHGYDHDDSNLDIRFFSSSTGREHWTSSQSANRAGSAWRLNVDWRTFSQYQKENNFRIRLVRGTK